jgi:hypothetical protein
MKPRTVHFRVVCSNEDPHAPARVMGLLAARSLLPVTFKSTRLAPSRVEIDIVMEEWDGLEAAHLARLFDRLVMIDDVELDIDGKSVPFRAVNDDRMLP